MYIYLGNLKLLVVFGSTAVARVFCCATDLDALPVDVTTTTKHRNLVGNNNHLERMLETR